MTTKYTNSIDVVLGILFLGRKMLGTDVSTELFTTTQIYFPLTDLDELDSEGRLSDTS